MLGSCVVVAFHVRSHYEGGDDDGKQYPTGPRVDKRPQGANGAHLPETFLGPVLDVDAVDTVGLVLLRDEYADLFGFGQGDDFGVDVRRELPLQVLELCDEC